MKIIMTYMSVVPLITLYKILKDTGVSIKEFAIRVLGNISKTTAIYFLANLGIVIAILVFSELILDGNDFDLLSRTLTLLLGGFYIPAMINSVTEVKNETLDSATVVVSNQSSVIKLVPYDIVDILDDEHKVLSSTDYRCNNHSDNISEEVLEFLKENKLYEV
jgi:hypothetical protein